MRNIVLLTFLLLPLASFAETCDNGGNAYSDLSCADRALDAAKKDLNEVYKKIYSSTQYKSEFEQSQKAWLNYREKQCRGYVEAEASQSQGVGPALITKDCLYAITKQRVDYLKTLLGR